MHDIRLIRDDPEAFDAGMAKRALPAVALELVNLDRARRSIIAEKEALEGQRKRNSAFYGQLRGQGQGFSDEAMQFQQEAIDASNRLKELEPQVALTEAALKAKLEILPNLPLLDVPEGVDETDNQLIHEHGTRPAFSFPVKEHDAIGPALGLDFETGVAIAGARFTLVRGHMAKLNRALGQFGLDTLTREYGYEEIVPPLMVRKDSMFGTGQLPKFKDDLFHTDITLDTLEIYEFKYKAWLEWMGVRGLSMDTAPSLIEPVMWNNLPDPETRRWLIPTAEVSLTNIVREKILAASDLPLRFTALTPCFRSEAGSAGRDTRGFIRQHQFEKAEMVSIVEPDASEAEHERMTAAAEHVLSRLELPFRRMKLCTGDMGFTAARTYDLEVWLPGQGQYREISSCSTCTDFQARRMNTQYRPEGQSKKPWPFVHTLNGSGLVVGRMIVAIIENYQQEDGSVAVPSVLQPYLGGLNRLEPR